MAYGNIAQLLAMLFAMAGAEQATQPDQSEARAYSTVPSVRIGAQVWMARNVAVTQFRNGDPIPELRTTQAWISASTAGQPGRVAYANAEENIARWGYLYNYAAVADPRGICPAGWRVPNDADWRTLETSLGGGSAASNALKARTGWSANGGGSDSTGFSALPGGWRTQTGVFYLADRIAYFWSTSRSGRNSTAHMLFNESRPIFRIGYDIGMGQSLRCIAN
jgi:uncharacterized protein (TIGR02145 family)